MTKTKLEMESQQRMRGSSKDRLDSWKAIAAYLARDLRTVKRWEGEKGLPVHRVPGGLRRAVFAYPHEVDAWLKGLGDDRAATTDHEADSLVAASSSPPSSTDSRGPTRPSVVANVVLRAWPGSRWLWLAVVCGLTVGAYWLWRRAYAGPVMQVSFSSSTLVARNVRGAILWTYDFDRPLEPNPSDPVQRAVIADMGPGRRRDVLAAAPFFSAGRANSASDALFCFSGQGKLRWHHAFDDKFRFGDHDDAPPWIAIRAPLVLASGGASSSIWWPALDAFGSAATLTEFDRDGNRLAQFVNWGHISVLGHVRNTTGSYILAGGISNQCDCAMLAVLREDHASGSSPPLPRSTANCENCPAGRPYRYLLFPQSELTQLSGASYNNLKVIHVDDGRVWVGVGETRTAESPGPDWEEFDLSESFAPRSYTVSDHYWTLHRQMEAEGKIHHTVEQCPYRAKPKRVRMWSPEHGWEEIAVPVAAGR